MKIPSHSFDTSVTSVTSDTSVSSAVVSPWLPAVATWLRERVAGWRAAAQRTRHQRAVGLLDDATLRDLGLRRSEIGSVLAEAAGEAELTRQRIASALQTAAGPSVIRM
jgi:uncharacterized protein YjiS (DUF1127 family)